MIRPMQALGLRVGGVDPVVQQGKPNPTHGREMSLIKAGDRVDNS